MSSFITDIENFIFGDGTSLTWTGDLVIDAIAFVTIGISGGYIFRWNNSSFLTIALMTGSAGAIATHFLVNSSPDMQKVLAQNVRTALQDLPMYILSSVLVGIGGAATMVLMALLLEETVIEFIEPILFFLPSINENMIIWSMLGRFIVPAFMMSLFMNLFIAGIYTYPLEVMLYAVGLEKKPKSPDGRDSFCYAALITDVPLTLLALPREVIKGFIQVVKDANYYAPLMIMPATMTSIGNGFGDIMMDVMSKNLVCTSAFTEAWDKIIGIFT